MQFLPDRNMWGVGRAESLKRTLSKKKKRKKEKTHKYSSLQKYLYPLIIFNCHVTTTNLHRLKLSAMENICEFYHRFTVGLRSGL